MKNINIADVNIFYSAVLVVYIERLLSLRRLTISNLCKPILLGYCTEVAVTLIAIYHLTKARTVSGPHNLACNRSCICSSDVRALSGLNGSPGLVEFVVGALALEHLPLSVCNGTRAESRWHYCLQLCFPLLFQLPTDSLIAASSASSLR